MTGRVQKIIAHAFAANPEGRFTVEDFAKRAYLNPITPAKLACVRRALLKVKDRYDLHACRVGHKGCWRHVWGKKTHPLQLNATEKQTLIEIRQSVGNETRDIEARFAPPTDTGEIEGVAVRFSVVDSYRTEFAPDAFRGLEARSIPMLWSHDPAQVIGSWSSFQVRADGLTAKGRLNLGVAKAQEVRALLQAGDVKGLSIGFRTLKDARQSNGVRRITEAQLHEISVVAFPAVPGSGITHVRATGDVNAFITATRAASATLKG